MLRKYLCMESCIVAKCISVLRVRSKWQIVIHSDASSAFQKCGSVGPWFSKNGAMLQNMGSMIFVSKNFVKSRINQTLNMGAFGHR